MFRLPREQVMKREVTIDSWAVVPDVSLGSFEELCPGNRLMGYVRGHANLPGSTLVFTSVIVSADLEKGLVETGNTMYKLGQASADYKSWLFKRRASAA